MGNANREEFGEMLSAYVDGELDAAESRVVERLLREDASARQLVERLRRAASAMAALPRHSAPSTLVTDLQGSLERSALLDEVQPFQPHAHSRRAPWSARLSVAAVFALVAVTGWWFVADRSHVKQELSAAHRAERETDLKRAAAPRTTSVEGTSAPVSALTFDEKLASGTALAALQAHSFAAESARMHLTVADSAEGEALTARIVNRLAGERVADLRGVSAKADEPDGVFLRGAAGVNFQGAGETQVLVRARPSQLAAVIGDLESAGTRDEAVAFSTGSLRVEGLSRSQAFVGLLDQRPAPRRGDGAKAATPRRNETKSDDYDWLAGLLKVVNVDPDLVRPPDPAPEPADSLGERVVTAKNKDVAQPGVVRVATESSLVEKRMKELSKSAGGRGHSGPEAAGSANDEKLITVVIELAPSKRQPASPLPAPSEKPSVPRPDQPKGSR